LRPDWWTEATKIADGINDLMAERGTGEWLPVVACLFALRRALDEAEAPEEGEAPPELKRLKKSVAKAIEEFAVLAGTAS
jgi:hypothetical protein